MKQSGKPFTALAPLAALALTSLLLVRAEPAAAQGCGGGPLSTSSGNLIGSAVGAAAGGLLGNQFGRGAGQGVMTGVGVVGGALAGGYAGRQMEGCGNAPRQTGSQAAYHPARAAQGAAPRTASVTRTCHYVQTQAEIDGREQPIDGIACLEPDGSWKTASDPAAQRAAQYDLVLRAQQRLREDGFYVRNNIDGQWGRATSTAVGNYQRANGLPATGQLDLATRSALGLDSGATSAPVAQGGVAGQAENEPPPSSGSSTGP